MTMLGEQELKQIDSILEENKKLKEYLQLFLTAYDGGAAIIPHQSMEEIRDYIK